MNEHRYILEPYKGLNSRYRCPGCQQREKTFCLYIDTQTGKQINPAVGRCNRESNCGYHYTPKQYFHDNNISFDTIQPRPNKKNKAIIALQKPVSFIPVDKFKDSLKSYEENNFVKFLNQLFGVEVVTDLISKYFIGTSKHWPGATIFWQVDKHGKIRTGKIMLYKPDTGKRIKEPFSHIQWVHKALKIDEFELKQCLFGEHLLKERTKPVAIVESEKTAIIASVFLPAFIWLAVGSLTNLNVEKCQVIAGRNVFLFPDLNGFDKWKVRADQIFTMPGTSFNISNYLQLNAPDSDKQQGLDIADYLIRFDYQKFTKNSDKTAIRTEQSINNQPYPINGKSGNNGTIPKAFDDSNATPAIHFKPFRKEFTSLWDITELETYFKGIQLPTQPIKLSYCSTINDVSNFIHSHIETLKNNNGNRIYVPFL